MTGTIRGCAALAALLCVTASAAAAQARPEATYRVYVGAESADHIYRIRFGPEGAEVEKEIPIGTIVSEMEGPHGLVTSPDGKFLYMTTGHGAPDGMLWKFAAGPDTLAAVEIPLGSFPASLDVTPDGLYAFIVNFNLHGEMVPSDVSVVYTPNMTEVERVVTCTMPHGSRVNAAGTHQYSTCMMDDQLVEIDTRSFAVSRRFNVARGAEGPLQVVAVAEEDEHADHGMDAEMEHGAMHEPSCSPTWAQPSPDGAHIYVACNKSNEVLEIDARAWTLKRRFATERGPYNLAITSDGRLLVVTNKQGGGVQFIDIASGASRGFVKSSTTLTHGVALSPDARYAFVSVEGVGAEPGKVDIYDLRTFEQVASVAVGQQASGITFWSMEP